ncbi:TPA: hypothetical protein ACFOWQ_001961, partial [Neisseria meningitidis]
ANQRCTGLDLIHYTCVMVLGTHHQPALHSVVLSGNCPVVSMGCPAAPCATQRLCALGGRGWRSGGLLL